jgi:hypothetical protein
VDGWGDYGVMADRIVFVLCMVAWNLLMLDLVQGIKRYNRRKKRRAEWKSSGEY